MAVEIEKQQNSTYPVVKWAGGKRQLINDLLEYMPDFYNNYFEPFIGGGALFFELQAENAYISDINDELINLYKVIQNDVYTLIRSLEKHSKNFSKEYFLYLRNLDRLPDYETLSEVEKASRFIFLNRTCFNGLYRVNSKGHFNVPFGKYKNPRIVDEQNLINCSFLLKKTKIQKADFNEILNYVQKNDFVYFDPPYVPLNDSSYFTSYTKEGFTWKDQEKLKKLCDKLTTKGVRFMLSNSDTEETRKLYSKYEIITVYANRNINANGDGRGKITEILVRNYKK